MLPEERKKIVDFPDDADPTDPFEVLCWLFTQFPAIKKMQEMPPPRVLAPYFSDWATRLGIRYHPELAILFKIPDPKNPGRAIFVNKEKYEEYKAKGNGDVNEGLADEALNDLLKKVDPKLASELDSLTDEEKATKREALAGKADEAMKTLMKLRETLEVKD